MFGIKFFITFRIKSLTKNSIMKHKKLKLSILLLFGLISSSIAQQTIPTSGGDVTGSGGSISYSVGQVVYTTNSGSGGFISQGVQQPYEISVIDNLDETKEINLFCAVYPNPTTELLTLEIENYVSANLSYQLYDMNGKLIENKKLTGNSNTISTTSLIPAIYFLKVIDNNKEVKIFKIIKN
jgi:type IX secretion system substrate protein